MAKIKINVTEHLFTVTEFPLITSNNVSIDEIEAEFDESWDGYAKIAVFKKKSWQNSLCTLFDCNNIAKLPDTVGSGKLILGIVGIDSESQITTNIKTISIAESAEFDGIEAPEEDVYRQILDSYARVINQRSEIDAEIHRVEAQANANYETVNERVNNLVATDPGSTGDNAELLDIRVGSDGKVYSTAGEAVRVQVSELKSDLAQQLSIISSGEFYDYEWTYGALYNGGIATNTTTSAVSKTFEILAPCTVHVSVKDKTSSMYRKRVGLYKFVNNQWTNIEIANSLNAEFEGELFIESGIYKFYKRYGSGTTEVLNNLDAFYGVKTKLYEYIESNDNKVNNNASGIESLNTTRDRLINEIRTNNLVNFVDGFEKTDRGLTVKVIDNRLSIYGTISSQGSIACACLVSPLEMANGKTYYWKTNKKVSEVVFQIRPSSGTADQLVINSSSWNYGRQSYTNNANLTFLNVYVIGAVGTSVNIRDLELYVYEDVLLPDALPVERETRYKSKPIDSQNIYGEHFASCKERMTDVETSLNDGIKIIDFYDDFILGYIDSYGNIREKFIGESSASTVFTEKYHDFKTDSLKLITNVGGYIIEYNSDYSFNKRYTIGISYRDINDHGYFKPVNGKHYRIMLSTTDISSVVFYFEVEFPNVHSNSVNGIETVTISKYNTLEYSPCNDGRMYVMQSKNGVAVAHNSELILPITSNERIAKIALFSDVHIGSSGWGASEETQDYANLHNAIEYINSNDIDFCLGIGDLLDGNSLSVIVPTENQNKIWDDAVKKLKIPFVQMQGNHDVLKRFGNFAHIKFNGLSIVYFLGSWVERSSGFSQFCVTNTISDEEKLFINNALSDDADVKILSSHFSMDASENKLALFTPDDRAWLQNVCAEHGVKLYISGHEHDSNWTIYNVGNIRNISVDSSRKSFAIITITKDNAKFEILNMSDLSAKTSIGENGIITLPVN